MQYFLIFAFFSTVFCCGATTHNVIARVALEWLGMQDMQQMIEERLPIFQNGAAFPDWGYPLEGMHDAAEAAHWPPFINATIQYIRSQYSGPPFGEEAKDLIVHIFGVTSHSVSDVIWHDLSIVSESHQGWIQSMADLDFFGDYSNAHDTSDTGGEFMLSRSYDLNFLENEWYFPIYDILKIYQSINHTEVTMDKMIEGNLLLFAATEAARHVEDPLYFLYAEKSPFLQERLWDFFYGGLDDMAVWVNRCWGNLNQWLYDGPYSPFCLVDPSDNKISSLSKVDSLRVKRFYESEYWQLYGQLYIDNVEVILDKSMRRAIFRNKEPIEVIYHRIKNDVFDQLTSVQRPLARPSPPSHPKESKCASYNGNPLYNASLTITSSYSHAFLGNSLAIADFNRNGQIDLVLGAPGYWTSGQPQMGAVFILMDIKPNDGHQVLFIDFPPHSDILSYYGTEVGAKFGFQVTVVDINADGADDLVVSAPSSKSQYMDYRGEIYIYLYNLTTNTLSPNISTTIYVPGIIDPKGPASGAYTNAGTTLTSFDIDSDGFKDLIVGSYLACDANKNCKNNQGPLQRGMVAVFLSSRWSRRKDTVRVSLVEADWIKYGDQSHSWFGYHLNFVSEGNLQLLLVGAPLTLIGENPEAGILYAFLAEDILNNEVNPPPYFTINGTKKWDNLGAYTSAGSSPYNSISNDTYLFLSLPSHDVNHADTPDITIWQAGATLLIKLSDILPMSQTVNSLVPRGVFFKGGEPFSRMGWNSVIQDINGDHISDILITEPFVNHESGRIYAFFGGNTFFQPGTVVEKCLETSNLCFGYNALPIQAHYGSNIVIEQECVVETTPRDSQFGIELAGSVTIIFTS